MQIVANQGGVWDAWAVVLRMGTPIEGICFRRMLPHALAATLFVCVHGYSGNALCDLPNRPQGVGVYSFGRNHRLGRGQLDERTHQLHISISICPLERRHRANPGLSCPAWWRRSGR